MLGVTSVPQVGGLRIIGRLERGRPGFRPSLWHDAGDCGTGLTACICFNNLNLKYRTPSAPLHGSAIITHGRAAPVAD
jgi:hypothetical protein